MSHDIVEISPVSAVSQNVVFSTSLSFFHHSGSARIPVDVASGISGELGIQPVFISDEKVGEFLMRTRGEGAVVVGINLFPGEEQDTATRKRMVTIDVNDTRLIHDRGSPPNCDVFLNPRFNPLNLSGLPRKEDMLIIDYSLLPSRMERVAKKSGIKMKTIATYFRNAGKEAARRLCDVVREIDERHSAQFLVSTGPATSERIFYFLAEKLEHMPNAEIFIYDSRERKRGASVLDDYFSRADAIIVSDDSVSTLSDAAKTGLPVFLLMDPVRHELMMRKNANAFARGNANHEVQKRLMAEDRLRPLTADSLLSDWQPPYKDEWGDINRKIADMVRQRLRGNQRPSMVNQAA